MAGDPRHDGPLDLLATVAAAAPWQKMRCQQGTHVRRSRVERRLRIERSDLRVTRFRNHKPSTIIIAVDASGSAALHRLGEAKGAVELLLSECYVRRDKVALIAFRGIRADVLLPPTRSLVRAKRELAGLPGGGTTPLACGIDRARKLALVELRAGHDCRVVLLTDGRCNIDRSGAPGRVKALADAEHAARQLVADHVPCLMIDTSRRGNEQAATLAALMAAPYLPLPHAEAHDLAHRIRRSDARR
jgi:magnesium chelatase subunit D